MRTSPPNGDDRRVLKVKPAEDTQGIHRAKDGRLRGVSQRITEVETLNTGPVIRRIETNDFCVLGGGFRKKILIRGENVCHPHVWLVRIAAGANDMPFQINGVLVVGRDRKDPDHVAILDFESFQLFRHLGCVASIRDVQTQHRLLFMGDQALDFYVPEGGGGK
jgi:hypothetical protein